MQPIRPQPTILSSSSCIELAAMQQGRPTTSMTAVAGSSSSSPSYYTAVGSFSAFSQPPQWWQFYRQRHPGSGRCRLLGSEENRYRESMWRSGFWALLGGLVVALFIVVPTTPLLLLDSDLMWHRRPKLLVRQRRVGDNRRRTFRIMQLTDLHLGEAPHTEWGPAQDVQTFRLLRDLLAYENNNRIDDDTDDNNDQDNIIDLVIFSGDQLTGNDVDGNNATVYYDQLGRLMEEMQLPYAMIFGNHDDMDYIGNNNNDGTLVQHRARTFRRALATSDRRHRHSLTPIGPAHVFGVSNGVLNVYHPTDGGGDSQQQQQPALQVVLLDSGGGSLPEQIVADQLDWYRSRRRLDVPAIAFQHIPTEQFRYKDNASTGDDDQAAICSGFDGENGIAPLDDDPTGEIARLAEIDTNLLVLAVGHNHGNSYCCEQQQRQQQEAEAPTTASATVLCFGRHSGYGGYGRWDRGARIFTFHWEKEEDSAPATMSSWHTYVRLQDGNITDAYERYM
jgi:hypothetical protein